MTRVRIHRSAALAAILSGFALALPTAAFALPDEITTPAQAKMIGRIADKIDAFVAAKTIDPSLTGYCQSKLALDTRHETDGSIPFGVNYRTLKTMEELAVVINAREVFELNYLKLCLAEAQRSLNETK